MTTHTEGYRAFKEGRKIPKGAGTEFVAGWWAAYDIGERFGNFESPNQRPSHGSITECIGGIALPDALRDEPAPYTNQWRMWQNDIFDYVVSWDGGVPANTVDHIATERCPGCDSLVALVTEV